MVERGEGKNNTADEWNEEASHEASPSTPAVVSYRRLQSSTIFLLAILLLLWKTTTGIHRSNFFLLKDWQSNLTARTFCARGSSIPKMLLNSVASTSGAVLGRTAINATFRQALVRCRSTVAAEQTLDGNRLGECSEAKPYSEVPGPKPIPLLGNVWRFLPGIGELSKVKSADLGQYLFDNYGPIMKLTGLPGKPDMIFVTDADACEMILRNEGVWPVREGTDSLEHYLKECRKEIKKSLAASQGKEWQEFRTAVNQVMMQPRRARMYINPINKVAEEFLDRMWSIRDEKEEMPDDFLNELSKYALESITYVTLDTRLGTMTGELAEDSEPQKMVTAVKDIFDSSYKLDFLPSPWKFISTPTYRRFVKSMDFFQAVAHKHVMNAMNRLKSLPPAELGNRELSLLERLLVETEDPGTAVAMALDMMLAGVDTTSMLIAVSMYNISAHPQHQRLLQEELDRVIPDPSKPITAEQLEQFKYLRACVKESNRLTGVAPANARSTVKEMMVMGYQIPKGSRMVLNHGVMSKDDEYFPRANEFLPERWLPGGESLKAKHPFAFLPFGFGPRKCVGKRFADLEIEIFLAKLFRNYSTEWHHPPPTADVRLLLSYTSPLKFTLKKRS